MLGLVDSTTVVTSAVPSWIIECFSEKLLFKGCVRPVGQLLTGKHRIAIYFSTQKLPPSKGLTAILETFYAQVMAAESDLLEIVFVSSDESQCEFDDHFSSMPWSALPYAYREKQNSLLKRFRVLGLPRLVLLDGADGKVIDADAASVLVENLYDIDKAFEKWK